LYGIETDTDVIITTSDLGRSVFPDNILKVFSHIPADRFTLPGRYKDGTHLKVGP